jgi:hypothetical protein
MVAHKAFDGRLVAPVALEPIIGRAALSEIKMDGKAGGGRIEPPLARHDLPSLLHEHHKQYGSSCPL